MDIFGSSENRFYAQSDSSAIAFDRSALKKLLLLDAAEGCDVARLKYKYNKPVVHN